MGHLELLYKPAALVPEESKGRLVVVSNRVPTTSAAPAAGGPLQSGVSEAGGTNTVNRTPLKLDAPATLTSRFEPKDTAKAFSKKV